MSSNGHRDQMPDGLSETEQAEWTCARNCAEVAAGIEDMQHRNLARSAILHEMHGVDIDPHELLTLKCEVLLDFVCGSDELQRLTLGFFFQQKWSDYLSSLEAAAHKEG